ncbi:MAG: type II toxin-antitoxin system Phd/YefM family antitoxin [Oscillospiraceae bacterium]|nr:type II toxin-antitoxin system Phd/YefM family antitoxin [Oscillospiraceae bacterium]
MIALKTVDLRNDFRRVSKLVSSGERVLIVRPHNENLVVLSEREYNELEKAKRNAEYLAMLDKSMSELNEGKVVVKTLDELKAME